ncbi:hypothetical protein MVLG_02361 [Microbotryum lychnidis-dioicae p1A1 Lamole]|uniref:Acetyl-CoA acyltransferase n=3 Tax=Microbotryum TaxID=34416 RepID=U5H4X8_USTV1|nr:hypothetical protein MVLG_02361 [Microbotryum lychnidis-dioicae p1A1 Lamole]|eukprot:KDE07316.1 hypothetical protein MVLG_02361 [Microbotryum lychnidis-dioicae p1A1 Lamole]
MQATLDNIVGTSGRTKLLRKNSDDIVVTFAKRTSMCKARKGGFKDMSGQELMIAFFKGAIAEMKVDPAVVEDIVFGTVLPPKAPYDARASALAAGFPETTSVQVINRFCSSGLMAIQSVANQIRVGEIEVGFAVGFESMSAHPDRGADEFAQEILDHPVAADCQHPMGWTSENVSKDLNVPRKRMDELAAASHQRAGKAQKSGIFADEIIPITALQAPSTPSAEGAPKAKRVPVLVKDDDGIRPDSTAEGLSKIRPAFPQWGNGTTTGGNASQLTDGVAGVLLMKRSKAQELGLPILAKHVVTCTVGLAPRIMGIGPAIAIPKALAKAGITREDVDLWEVNEAFASMLGYLIDTFGLPHDKVNIHGGAIALGHPLGCTGARQVATGLNAIKRTGGKILVTSMCIGLGMGAAGVWVNEQ